VKRITGSATPKNIRLMPIPSHAAFALPRIDGRPVLDWLVGFPRRPKRE